MERLSAEDPAQSIEQQRHPNPLTTAYAEARAVPRQLSSRNASMRTYDTLRSPGDYRRGLQRSNSLQSPTRWSPETIFGFDRYVLEVSPHSPSWAGAMGPSPLAGRIGYSPRRKRLRMDSPSAQRSMGRRLFFGEGSNDPNAPESRTTQLNTSREDSEAALCMIRDAVEDGNAYIDLSDLGITSVPDELAELRHLVVLTAGNIMGTGIQLSLRNNMLLKFPLAVCELTNLTLLIISHNCIDYLPPEIGNLVNLRELSVAHNRLHVLPSELNKLGNLVTLSLFPNPFIGPPPLPSMPQCPEESKPVPCSGTDTRQTGPEALFRNFLVARAIDATMELWPFTVHLTSGVPRLADFAARKLSRPQLITLKHQLVMCVEDVHPPIGRIIGPAVESSEFSVSAALKSQHLELSTGHECAVCGQWFLLPPVHIIVWAQHPLSSRQAPFRIRLCSKNCLYSEPLISLLKRPASSNDTFVAIAP